FDPIALRIQATAQRYRIETIVLPLIDNSVYSSLARVLGGKPEPLDALPVSRRNIFSVNGRLNKKELLKEAEKSYKEVLGEKGSESTATLRKLGVPEKEAKKLSPRALKEFLAKGLGNQVGLHLYDATPIFDINVPNLLGLLLGTFTDEGDRLT